MFKCKCMAAPLPCFSAAWPKLMTLVLLDCKGTVKPGFTIGAPDKLGYLHLSKGSTAALGICPHPRS